VREIDFDTAHRIIRQYEWLGNMGTTEYAFGLYFGPHLAGVVCFGRTAGTNVNSSIAGEKNAALVKTLCRGACVHWAHPHSASFLISRACALMVKKGFHIFVAYSNTEAGEIGTVYQACNWLYCGMTSPTEKFKTPNGEIKDARLVHAYTRDRRGANGNEYRQRCSRAEMKQSMIDAGCEFFKGLPKHKYVGIYGGDARIRRRLKKEMLWGVLPYPKRDESAPQKEAAA
jgi:hypothetical protein